MLVPEPIVKAPCLVEVPLSGSFLEFAHVCRQLAPLCQHFTAVGDGENVFHQHEHLTNLLEAIPALENCKNSRGSTNFRSLRMPI